MSAHLPRRLATRAILAAAAVVTLSGSLVAATPAATAEPGRPSH